MRAWFLRFGTIVALTCSTLFLAEGAHAQCPVFALTIGGEYQLNNPVAVAIGPNGNVYVAGHWDDLNVFTSTGAFVTKWGSSGLADGAFFTPLGVAVDGNGNVYVSDYTRVQKFSSAGTYIRQLNKDSVPGGQFTPNRLAVDAAGNLYVTEDQLSLIAKFSPDGVLLNQWSVLDAGSGQYQLLEGIAVDAAGYVYASEYYSSRIEKFTSSGEYVTQWGFASNCGASWRPFGVAIDASGNVIVSDECQRVVEFTSTGAYLCQWGSGGTGDGQFANATGVAADHSGNVYVVDFDNARVEKFVQAPVPTNATTWGRIKASYR